jgi:hypothetical protein
MDGSVKPRQPNSEVGGIIRKGDGSFIFPFAKKISFVPDPFLAELRVVFVGPRCCLLWVEKQWLFKQILPN